MAQGEKRSRGQVLAPLGYAMATTLGLALVLAAWFF